MQLDGMEGMYKVLSDFIPLSEDFKKDLEQGLIPLSLPKNHFLLGPPKTAEHIFFLVKGFVMGYSFDDGQKRVDSFWGPGDIILSQAGCFEKISHGEFIQLMETSEVLCLPHKALAGLFETHKEARALYRIVLGGYYINSRERFVDLQRLTLRQRHEKLLARYPHIEQKLPQEHIASYLSITPQSLSRLKRQQRRGNP
jgi:CRP/FNR family transcriptional regulator, anaerobic regulatory protein